MKKLLIPFLLLVLSTSAQIPKDSKVVRLLGKGTTTWNNDTTWAYKSDTIKVKLLIDDGVGLVYSVNGYFISSFMTKKFVKYDWTFIDENNIWKYKRYDWKLDENIPKQTSIHPMGKWKYY